MKHLHALPLFLVLAVSVMGQDKALDLDGKGSYVELPTHAFTNLDTVTVEGWVKWESFRPMSRFFDFTLARKSLNVQNRFATST